MTLSGHCRADCPCREPEKDAEADAVRAALAAERERDEWKREALGKRAALDALTAERDALSARLQAVRYLFGGGPDTPCRTVWQDGIECVSVPIADLRAPLDASLGTPGDETATARLCDERGMTEYRRPGNPYPCTGSMHVGPDEVVRCDNPIHDVKPQPSEPESMVWHGADCPLQPDGKCAEIIVAWVNANGGEARYETEYSFDHGKCGWQRIAVRTFDGWQYAKPGDRIVKGHKLFQHDQTEERGFKYLTCISTFREFAVSPVESSGSAE